MKVFVTSLLALLSPLLFAVNRALAEVPPLPVQITEGAWRPLSTHEDSSLEDRLAQALKRNALWQALISSFPELHDKFVRVTARGVPLAHLCRKSGTWHVWYSDSVLVWDETGGKYILVAMVENEQGEEILRQLVPVTQKPLNVKEAL